MGEFYVFIFYLLGGSFMGAAFLELFTSTRAKPQKYIITGACFIWSLCLILVLPRFINLSEI